MLNATDRRVHSRNRSHKKRTRTLAIVLHRTVGPGVDDAVHFFTQDPEGIATVCLSGTYMSKVPIINDWRARGVPTVYQGRGFVPYHILVDADGKAHQMLDLDVVGAHAGAWNDRTIAIACPGDFRSEPPAALTVEAVIKACEQLRAQFPTIKEIIDHDEVNRRIKAPEKGCIGRCFPVDFVRKEVVKETGSK